MHNLLYRADANPLIGTGDLISLIELSKKLPSTWNHVFCCRETNAAKNILSARNIQKVHWIDKSVNLNDEKHLINQLIKENNFNAFLMEITQYCPTFYTGIASDIFKVSVNFCNAFPEDSSLVIDWSVNASNYHKVNKYSGIKFLLGPEYVILPDEIEKQFLKRNETNKSIENILVTMGGNDEWNLSIEALESLEKLNFSGSVALVLGAGYQHADKLNAYLSNATLDIRVLKNLPSLLNLYSWADLAIATGGLTVSELIATKTPALISAAYPHEEERCKYFHKRGWIQYLGLRKISESKVLNSLIIPPKTATHFPFRTFEIINTIKSSLEMKN